MQKRIFCYVLAWILCGSDEARSQEALGNNILRIIPLTTQTSVKLEVTFSTMPDPGLTFEIQIFDSAGSLFVKKQAKPSEIIQSEKKMLFYISGLSPRLWSPAHPNLYSLQFRAYNKRTVKHERSQRIGFRFFESKDGNLYLNGKPVFLRGIAINPPARGIPDSIERSRAFAMDYVRFMKSIHVNIIRIPNDETWFNVCDELGMMVFGGNYGASVGGGRPPANYDSGVAWYRNEKLAEIAAHPSLMIYALTNEVPFAGAKAKEWELFLSYAHKKLKTWDSTRAYIGNAGYGYGKSGDICDLHRYWGWYYSSPFTFLHIRDNRRIIPFEKGVQPVTFTECVGNYTGPDGRYNLTPAHKNPGSQLNWTGHAAWDRQADLADEHQSFTFKQATELFRRLRRINPELSGVFPFTIMFHNWHTIGSFVDMSPKAVTKQAALSYQPVLLSWENWTSQVYAGSIITPVLHIVNDDDQGRDLRDLRIVYQLQDHAQSVVLSDTFSCPSVPYYQTYRRKLSVSIPGWLRSGRYRLTGKIFQSGKLISENHDHIFIASADMDEATRPAATNVLLYDPQGQTKRAFQRLNIPFTPVSDVKRLPAASLLVVGANGADNNLLTDSAALKKFVRAGGRVLFLRQDSVSFLTLNGVLDYPLRKVSMDLDNPVYPPPPRPSHNAYYINPERPDHAVFRGIERAQLRVWSDYTGWDESKDDFPAIYPVTDGFVPVNKSDVEHIAVLANYGVALEGMALIEQFAGKGSILISAFDLVRRAGLDPIADRMLFNMISYMSAAVDHPKYVTIHDQIIWGDYASENGMLTGVYSGLLLNSRAVLTGSYSKQRTILTEEGDRFGGQRGGFNTRPGVQYVHYGRRPYGPYRLRSFANIPIPLEDSDNEGEGSARCRIPDHKTSSSTLVLNQDSSSHNIYIRMNDQEVSVEILPGETRSVTCPVKGGNVHMEFRGDRRLVLIQTSFR